MKHPLLDTLVHIIRGICNHPSDLQTEVRPVEGGFLLIVKPHPADIPILVGHGGKQSDAFRRICLWAGRRAHVKMDISIRGESQARFPAVPWQFNPRFDFGKFENLLCAIVHSVFPETTPVTIVEEIEKVRATIGVERTVENKLIEDQIDAIFYPYVYANGRKLRLACRQP